MRYFFIQKSKLPQFSQVFDSPYLREVAAEIENFRPKLLAYMSNKKRLEYQRESVMTKKYDSDLKIFQDRISKWENSPKKRLRDQRNREQEGIRLYVKVFILS